MSNVIAGFAMTATSLTLHLEGGEAMTFPIRSPNHVQGSPGNDLTFLIGATIKSIARNENCEEIDFEDGKWLWVTVREDVAMVRLTWCQP